MNVVYQARLRGRRSRYVLVPSSHVECLASLARVSFTSKNSFLREFGRLLCDYCFVHRYSELKEIIYSSSCVSSEVLVRFR